MNYTYFSWKMLVGNCIFNDVPVPNAFITHSSKEKYKFVLSLSSGSTNSTDEMMQLSRWWKAIGIPRGSLSLRTYTLEVPTRTENTRNQKIKVYNQYSILNIKWVLFSTVHFHETDTPHDLTACPTTGSTRAGILMFLCTALRPAPGYECLAKNRWSTSIWKINKYWFTYWVNWSKNLRSKSFFKNWAIIHIF